MAIHTACRERRTISVGGIGTAGRLIPAQEPEYALVTLSPALMRACAERTMRLPTEVDGVPVRISEGPGRVNKPSGRYMVSVMVKGKDRPGLAGHSVLAEACEDLDK